MGTQVKCTKVSICSLYPIYTHKIKIKYILCPYICNYWNKITLRDNDSGETASSLILLYASAWPQRSPTWRYYVILACAVIVACCREMLCSHSFRLHLNSRFSWRRCGMHSTDHSQAVQRWQDHVSGWDHVFICACFPAWLWHAQRAHMHIRTYQRLFGKSLADQCRVIHLLTWLSFRATHR